MLPTSSRPTKAPPRRTWSGEAKTRFHGLFKQKNPYHVKWVFNKTPTMAVPTKPTRTPTSILKYLKHYKQQRKQKNCQFRVIGKSW